MSTKRTTRRYGFTRLHAVIAAAALALGSLGVLVTADTHSATAQPATLSGVFPGSGKTGALATFEAWRGRKASVVTDYVPDATWSALEDPSWGASQWGSLKIAWGLAMLPKTGGTLAQGATGAYNTHFQRLAQNLVADGHGGDIVRIGWEMNGNWFAWSAIKNPTGYASYWRQIVKTMRAVPGANFKFVWAPGVGKGSYAPSFTPDDAYPGDAYVDVIGTSLYDQSWEDEPADTAGRWDTLTTSPYGLNWQVDFARAHGKPFALSEWGLSSRCDGNGGGDNTHFVAQVAKFIETNNVYYETYFDANIGTCEVHRLNGGRFPKASAAYKAEFSAPMIPNGGSTSQRLSVAPNDLRVSWFSTMKQDKPLPWTGLSYRVWIFLSPNVSTRSVSYYIDDTKRSKAPLAVVGSAPYTLLGGGTAFDTAKLSKGRHTVTAAVTLTNGKVSVINAIVWR